MGGGGYRFIVMQEIELKERHGSFIEGEGKSCSMDIAGITSEYVFRMWEEASQLKKIANAMNALNCIIL